MSHPESKARRRAARVEGTQSNVTNDQEAAPRETAQLASLRLGAVAVARVWLIAVSAIVPVIPVLYDDRFRAFRSHGYGSFIAVVEKTLGYVLFAATEILFAMNLRSDPGFQPKGPRSLEQKGAASVSDVKNSPFRSSFSSLLRSWLGFETTEVEEIEEEVWCLACDAPKPPTTFHCSVCGRCISGMDHHCPFLGKCVGPKNKGVFILWLASLLLGAAYASLLAFLPFQLCFVSAIQDDFVSLSPEHLSLCVELAYAAVFFPLFLGFALYAAILLAMHLYLAETSQTTLFFFRQRVVPWLSGKGWLQLPPDSAQSMLANVQDVMYGRMPRHCA